MRAALVRFAGSSLLAGLVALAGGVALDGQSNAAADAHVAAAKKAAGALWPSLFTPICEGWDQPPAAADIIIANHTNVDESKRKLPAVQARTPGQPAPYVVGRDGVSRYLMVADECAQAGLARQS